jgi:hypothetical protein
MTTKMTVGETLKKIEHLQLKQAVMDELARFLDQFIPTDSFEPTKGISSSISAEVVPHGVIEEVRDEILATKVGAEKQIAGLKGQHVTGTKTTSKKAPTKKKVAKRAPPKRPPPKRRKTSAKK